jgi:hypothetical protein
MLAINCAITWALVGLIWTIQVVHYPLMAAVGKAEWAAYHAAHSERITFLVAPLMLAEVVAAGALVLARPSSVPLWAAWFACGLVAAAWLATGFLSVPSHGRLSAGLSVQEIGYLVATNWVRTAAWSARGGLLLWLLIRERAS